MNISWITGTRITRPTGRRLAKNRTAVKPFLGGVAEGVKVAIMAASASGGSLFGLRLFLIARLQRNGSAEQVVSLWERPLHPDRRGISARDYKVLGRL